MTQIEDRLAAALRSLDDACCGETRTRAERHAYRLALIEARAALAEYDTRTPSPASPTLSDTREQAAASPSQRWFTNEQAQAVLDAYQSLSKTPVTPFMAMVGALEALSSQAPKPASAGGYDLLVEARGWITKPASGHDEGMMYVDFIERLDAAISAKPASAGEPWKSIASNLARNLNRLSNEHVSTCNCGAHSALADYDRHIAAEADTAKPTNSLVPTEARGVVTDEYAIAADAVCKARNEWSEKHEEHWLETDENHPDDFIGRAVVDALRARESAPAVKK